MKKNGIIRLIIVVPVVGTPLHKACTWMQTKDIYLNWNATKERDTGVTRSLFAARVRWICLYLEFPLYSKAGRRHWSVYMNANLLLINCGLI